MTISMLGRAGNSGTILTRRGYWITALLMAAHLALVWMAPSIPWHASLFAFFFVTMVMLPGYIIGCRLAPARNLAVRLLVAFVSGTAAFFIVLLVFYIFHWDLWKTGIVMPAVTAAALILPFRPAAGTNDQRIDDEIRDKGAVSLVLLAVLIALAAVLILHRGDPLLYSGDSQDHIAYIRTVSRTHQAFPDEYLYKGGGILTRDIRKGLIHQAWGALNILTGRVDVMPVWPLISLIGSIMMLLALYAAGLILFRSHGIGFLSALIFVLFYHSGLRGLQLITIAYGFPFGKIFLVAFLLSSLRWIIEGKGEFLTLALMASIAAAGTHVGQFIACGFLVIVFTLAGPSVAQAAGKGSVIFMRGIWLGAASAAVNLPYLLLRYFRDYAPNNILHTEPQGLLNLYAGLKVLNPVVFFQSSGALCILSILTVFILWKRSSVDACLRLLLWGTISILVLVFNPLWVPFLMKRISYLLIRMEFAIPSVIMAAVLCRELWLQTAGRDRMVSRTGLFAGWAAVLAVFGYALVITPGHFAYSGPKPAGAMDIAPLYSAIDRLVPGSSVIASDPVTSYSIPAFTDQYVVCTYDQHSIPNDSTALERILAMRGAFGRDASAASLARVLARYGSRYVALNGRIPRNVKPMFWKPGPDDFERMDSILEDAQGCTRIFGDSLLALYDCGGMLDSMAESNALGPVSPGTPSAPPKVTGGDGSTAVPFERGRLLPEGTPLTPSGESHVSIVSVTPDSYRAARGDTVTFNIEWTATGKVEPKGYMANLRFNTAFPRGDLYSSWYGKIYRKIEELRAGIKYRFRIDFIPFGGLYPPDSWPERRIVTEKVTVRIPRYISPGEYSIALRLSHRVQYPNYYLRDIFTDDDVYQGEEVAKIKIE